ncbi:hypothetical protein KUTeg_012321 [Tegillarca granosa]|uniref:KY-like immunoglobulin-like domain-containing protein n=1 Tax=Tegillarca granosa TaxID=220873 RepID=A0ABQ9F1L6_TEGGR|nr:hypothetical protein KUTeg_012321 [Tegillarca granosa]
MYWQLLCRYISKDEWEKSVQILPLFFFYNLKLLNFSAQNLKVKTENCTITFQYPEEKKILFCSIILDANQKDEINASTFTENNIEKHSTNIYCGVRKTDLYTLKIYCREILFPFYVCVCILQIYFTHSFSDDVVLYQTSPRRQWGPGYDTIVAGLLLVSHQKTVIDIEDEFILIQFKLTCSLGLFFTLLDSQGNLLEKNILYWIADMMVFIKLTSPGSGSYTFNIFSSDGKKTSNSIPSCSYLLNFKTSPCERFKNFQIPNRKLGITEQGPRQRCLLLSETPILFMLQIVVFWKCILK